MADKIVMTALSPTMETGTIIEWKVKEGDSVKSGDVLCEVETDKASMELLSDYAGVVLKIIKDKGSDASVGDIIGAMGKAGEDVSAIVAEASASAFKAAAPAPAATPAPVATPAPQAVAVAPAPIKATPVPSTSEGDRLKASPLARRLATQKGIDLNYVKGTGPEGRITSADLVSEHVPLASVARKSGGGAMGSSSLNNDLIPLTGKRKVIAQRLTESKNSAPHFYLMTSIVMDDLLASREALNKSRKDSKIGVNAFLMKIIAQVVARHQIINSSWMGDAIQNHAQVDIGLAVAQPDGLITPIVKACEQKGILQIDEELNDLIARARNNKLKPEEYTGATFTISSLGSMGIEQFTSIINPPGVAILAIGSVKKEVVVGEEDEIVVKSMMKVTLSCDHRVVDGAVAARFLKDLRDTLENPVMALY
jgi:pyruvate dehydrogenase E2 component (dihydrolipoamide acetyltransferase)